MEATGFLFFKLCLVVTLAFGSADDVDGPFFIREPPNQVDFSNSTGAVIECAARGSPHPELTWVKQDGTVIGEVQGLRQVLPNGTLIFPPFRAEDYRQEVHAQVYRCLAQNHQGMITSRDVKVRAGVDQSFRMEVNNEHVIVGNDGIIRCVIPSFASDFVEVVAWETDDSVIIPKSRTLDRIGESSDFRRFFVACS